MAITISEAIQRTVEHREIFADEMTSLWMDLMTGKLTPAQIAGLIVGLRVKKETIGEITAAAKVMRDLSTKVNVRDPESLLDIVGTGGDGARTFNISTTSMFVIAAAGGRVAKHGGGSVSSKSGAADALKAIGANIMLKPEQIAQCIEETHMGFMFAPLHHAAMKYVGPIRKELGFRTVFNILGPLTNPAKPEMFLLGVYDGYLVEPLAKVLASLGVKRGLVAYGQEKLDEISPNGPTTICELRDGYYRTSVIKPEDFGLTPGKKEDLVGGTPEVNAQITRDVLSGKIQGTKRNAVLMNSGAALFVAGKADSIADGIQLAASLIDRGKATAALEKCIAVSNE